MIFDIKRFAVHDGPGIRTTVFFKGCELGCWWCHNPESRSPLPQQTKRDVHLESLCFKEDETIGYKVCAAELVHEIEKDRIFYEESGGGVTISGGEPLFQPEFLMELLTELHPLNFHIAIDTSGYAELKIIPRFLDLVDLFLYDLKLLNDKQHKKYTGVSNRRILDNLYDLFNHNKPVCIRFPIIPGVTDTDENLEEMCEFFTIHKENILEINLLPYHKFAGHKYHKLNMPQRMPDSINSSDQQIESIQQRFSSSGLKIKIGG